MPKAPVHPAPKSQNSNGRPSIFVAGLKRLRRTISAPGFGVRSPPRPPARFPGRFSGAESSRKTSKSAQRAPKVNGSQVRSEDNARQWNATLMENIKNILNRNL